MQPSLCILNLVLARATLLSPILPVFAGNCGNGFFDEGTTFGGETPGAPFCEAAWERDLVINRIEVLAIQ
jgi:hypothetical protein